MHLDIGLSKSDYNKLKLYSDTYEHYLLPCYDVLLSAANDILPKSLKQKLPITDRNIIFPTKDLAVLTIEQYLDLDIVKKQIESAIQQNPGKNIHTMLIFDTGLDSATGQRTVKSRNNQ